MLLNDQPLYLPEGSIRAIIALGVVAAFVAGYAPIEVATLVLGFYFGSRNAEAA
jgi:hypothetical protein